MPGNDESWLDSFTPEERAKIVLVNKQIFALLNTAAGLDYISGAVDRIAVSRIVQPVVAISSTGKPVPFVSSTGLITETYSSAIAANTNSTYGGTLYGGNQRLFTYLGPANANPLSCPMLSITQFALAGGVANNVDLTGMAARAGLKLCIRIIGIMSGTGIAAATITFHDSNPTAFPGLISGAAVCALVAYTRNTQLTDMVLGPATANKKGQVDVAGGAGVEVITIVAEYWYEA